MSGSGEGEEIIMSGSGSGEGEEIIMCDVGSLVSVSVVEDLNGLVQLYSDGSVVRAEEPSLHLPPLGESYEQVLYKDIVFHKTLGLWARLYLPPNAAATTTTRLPVILYFHGGGFCLFTPRSLNIHRFCVKWAADVGALIVSVYYRLAPEHRLPAAYHDSISALQWLHSESIKARGGGEKGDPWFDSHADFSKVFLMGDSSGGNIVHHLGMWSGGQEWGGDMRIRGLFLLFPFFGGEARTASEVSKESSFLTLEVLDALWRLVLPVGSNRDHHFCNPLNPNAGILPDVRSFAGPLPPIVMVVGGRDILRDKQLEYCQLLKKLWGNQIIEVMVFEEEDHGFAIFKMDEQNSIKLIEYASHFIKSAA